MKLAGDTGNEIKELKVEGRDYKGNLGEEILGGSYPMKEAEALGYEACRRY